MKQTAKTLFILAVGIILIPTLVFFKGRINLPGKELLTDEVKILMTDSGEVKSMPRKDYLLYSTLASIPADSEDEALLAQIVLQNTYIARERQNASAELKGADISDDETVYQKVLTEDEAKSAYADFDQVKTRLYSLIDSVYNKVLCYNSSPVLVAFFEGSFGYTESAEDIWDEDIEYLKSVKCESDADDSSLKSEKSFSKDEMKDLLENSFDLNLSSNAEDWIEISEKSDRGTPLTVMLNEEKKISASELYRVLDLASQHFELEYDDDKFIFTVKGSGHLVGVSLSFAEALAKSGKNCKEILTYFYKDCEITEI